MGAFDDLIDKPVAPPAVAGAGSFADLADAPPAAASKPPFSFTGLANFILSNAALHTTTPATAALDATVKGITGAKPGSSWGERYSDTLQGLYDYQKQTEQNLGKAAPSVAAVSSLPANIALGGGTSTLYKPLESAVRSAVPAAIEGAAKNAGSVADAGMGALRDALAAFGLSYGLNKGINSLVSHSPFGQRTAAIAEQAERGTDPDQLRASAKALYSQLDNGMVGYDASQMAGLGPRVARQLSEGGYSPQGAHAPLVGIVDDLNRMSQGQARFTEMDELRRRISTEMRSPDSNVRQMAGRLAGELDRIINTQLPAANPRGLDVQTMFPEARRLWRAASTADDTAYVASKAERRASTPGGADPDTATRSAFRQVEDRIERPGAYNPYSDRERELLARIREGGTIQNTQQNVGRAMQDSVPRALIGTGGPVLAMSTGFTRGHMDPAVDIPFFLAGPAMAAGSKGLGRWLQNAAAARGDENVNALLRQITTGSTAAPAAGAGQSRADLAKLIQDQLVSRVGGEEGGDALMRYLGKR